MMLSFADPFIRIFKKGGRAWKKIHPKNLIKSVCIILNFVLKVCFEDTSKQVTRAT